MIEENKTARQMWEALKAAPPRRFGFGQRAALVNIDLQCAYTQPETYPRAYETDPRQIEYVNALAAAFRARGWPVVWTYVAYLPSGEDCGVWGTRAEGPDALQNTKLGSPRAELDPRLEREPADIVMNKRMASAFFETNLRSLLTFHGIDTVVVTGGSTSGCVRATVVDGLSCGYRMIVPEECTADRHESPHFANLYDMAAKYADVLPVAEVLETIRPR
ncbi:isochorismatase family protein [Rhodovarius crocodyli]|uniref:Isochorismatase family protein n=1 Tax=Rhodovarius crocodyli TaxID=1979269 RepID=A0A437M464_9PROT|nr:isochorismatase family protein [Rhodovarius crocodyli]RVT92274.1 isochorismatase family protein [Rhodovarius crocodyli]